MTVPYTFATQNGPIPLSELDANFTSVSTASGINYTAPFTNAVTETLTNKLSQTASVIDFGADPTGAGDSTVAIQNAINYFAAGGIIYFPPGTYTISSTITKSGSFVGPNLIGAGYDCTTLNYAGISSNSSCLQFVGGSGYISSIRVEGFKFTGNSTSNAIEICGQDGIKIRDCYFSTNGVGLLFNNRDSGSFTEFNVAEDCVFNTAGTAVYYKVVSGNVSFHGSGLRNCVINMNHTYPTIHIGAGAEPYNSPLSCQLFSDGVSTNTFIQSDNNGSPYIFNCTFFGDITIEAGSTGPVLLGAGSASQSKRLYLSGSVISLGNYWSVGLLQICDSLATKIDGSMALSKKPWAFSQTLNSGANTVDLQLPYADSGIQSSSSFLVSINIAGAFYLYTYVYLFTPSALSPSYVPNITALQLGVQYDGAGWGAPTISVSSASPTGIIITNSSSGFSATGKFGLTQIGWSEPPL